MLNILMDFEIFHSRIKIYITFNVEVCMKCNINLLIPVLIVTYFYYPKVFKICIQLIKTQWKHGGFHNDIKNKFEPISLCLCWKIAIFKIWIWANILFGPFYHAWTWQGEWNYLLMSDPHMVVFSFEAIVVANMCCHEKCTVYHI